MTAQEKLNRIRHICENGELRDWLKDHLDDETITDIICLLDISTTVRSSKPTQELLGRMLKASYK